MSLSRPSSPGSAHKISYRNGTVCIAGDNYRNCLPSPRPLLPFPLLRLFTRSPESSASTSRVSIKGVTGNHGAWTTMRRKWRDRAQGVRGSPGRRRPWDVSGTDPEPGRRGDLGRCRTPVRTPRVQAGLTTTEGTVHERKGPYPQSPLLTLLYQ